MFLNVAIFEDRVIEKFTTAGADRPYAIHVFNALVDSGAQATCISRAAAERVGLTPIGMVPIRGVPGLSYHNNYLFRVGFAFGAVGEQGTVGEGSLHIVNRTIQGAEVNIQDGAFDVLLGMDILGMGSLKIDGDGSFVIAHPWVSAEGSASN